MVNKLGQPKIKKTLYLYFGHLQELHETELGRNSWFKSNKVPTKTSLGHRMLVNNPRPPKWRILALGFLL